MIPKRAARLLRLNPRPSSFRNRLILSLSTVFMLFSVVIGLSVLYGSRITTLNKANEQMNDLMIEVQSLFFDDSKFNSNINTNYYFYNTGRSSYLTRRAEHMNAISKHIALTNYMTATEGVLSNRQFSKLESLMMEYNALFEEITRKRLARGFKDYGKEGQMRARVHALLDDAEFISREDLLMLRRHEKDFFLRHETIYTESLNDLVDVIQGGLASNPSPKAQEELALLLEYRNLFNQIASLDTYIGKDDNSGLRGDLAEFRSVMQDQLIRMRGQLSSGNEQYEANYLQKIMVTLTVGMLMSILAIIFIVQKTSLPIEELAKRLNAKRPANHHPKVPYRRMPKELKEVIRAKSTPVIPTG